MIPQAIVMECSTMLPGLANKTTLFTVCDERWAGRSRGGLCDLTLLAEPLASSSRGEAALVRGLHCTIQLAKA